MKRIYGILIMTACCFITTVNLTTAQSIRRDDDIATCGSCRESASSSLPFLQDSVVCYGWNSSGAWQFIEKTISTYDANGNRINVLRQIFSMWSWFNKTQWIYTYDVNGNMLSETIQGSEYGITWENGWRWIYTYDNNGRRINELKQNWDDSTWVNERQYSNIYDTNGNLISVVREFYLFGSNSRTQLTYTYDSNGNQTSELLQDWDGSAWINVHLWIYTYDTNGNRIVSWYQDWDDSPWINDWVNVSQKFSTYDAYGNQTSGLEQIWDSSTWVNTNQVMYIYDNSGNRTDEVWQNWNDSIWINDEQYAYSYDASGNQTGKLIQNWNDSTWMDFQQYLYTYDANGNLESDIYQYWDETYWLNSRKCVYSYHEYTGIPFLQNQGAAAVSFYPNPFSANTTIAVDEKSYNGRNLQLTIYDLCGHAVRNLQITNNYTLERNNLPCGMYVYHLISDKRIIGSGKLVAE